MAFKKAVALSDLWDGEFVGLVIEGTRVLLMHVDGQIFAYEDKCAHLGVALSTGRLEGTVLTCRAHGWEYDVSSGVGLNPASVCLKRFPVKIHAGDVLVDVDPPQC